MFVITELKVVYSGSMNYIFWINIKNFKPKWLFSVLHFGFIYYECINLQRTAFPSFNFLDSYAFLYNILSNVSFKLFYDIGIWETYLEVSSNNFGM